MLDKLIDLIVQFIQLFQLYTFVDEYERGVILRCGKYHRDVGPGLRWMLPLGFERAITTNVKPEPRVFGIQSLHTADDYAVNLQVGIVFHVDDVRQYLLEVDGPEAIISTVSAGIITDTVESSKWRYVCSPEMAKNLKPKMNRIAKRCGCKIIEVAVQDCSSGEAIKYWHEGIHIGIGE